MIKKGISIAGTVLAPIPILIGLVLVISRTGNVFTVVGSLQANTTLEVRFSIIHRQDFQGICVRSRV